MSWIWAAVMPHPPILIPEVGHGRENDAKLTLNGIHALCAQLEKNDCPKPDFLLVFSPHQPYVPGAVFCNSAPAIQGSLAPFGAPQVVLELTTESAMLHRLQQHLTSRGIPVTSSELPDITKDHGTLVPLKFISTAFGGKLPPVVVASPSGLTPEQALELGRALADFAPDTTCALLASGDLSHCLKSEGPGGFHPDGAIFDQNIVRALTHGDPSCLLNLPKETLENAGECGLRSILSFIGLTGTPATLFSYEGPFGVGYCTALWCASSQMQGEPEPAVSTDNSATHPFPELARAILREYLTTDVPTEALHSSHALQPDWDTPKACFVTIKTKSGDLRGCIGTILPVRSNLKQEIMANAIAAGTQDPRFPPMTADELDDVTFSVDVLSTPEPVNSLAELDPAIWGVIVSKDGKRGLLLPDLPGVDTVEQQIHIAAQKAGITSLQDIYVERFRVHRYQEKG